MRAFDEPSERIRVLASARETLFESVRAECAKFLHTEIRVAHTFLDLASTTRDGADRARRLRCAAEAAGEVERHLAIVTPPRALSIEERAGLAEKLKGVRARMAVLG